MLLDQAQNNADQVSPKQANRGQVQRLIDENALNLAIVHSKRFECSDHIHPLNDHDKQSRNHVKTSDHKHQNNDDPNVHILQVEPIEHLRLKFLYGCREQLGSDGLINHVIQFLQARKVIYENLKARHLIGLPTVQSLNMSQIGDDIPFIIFRKARFVDAGHIKNSGPLLFILNEKHLHAVTDIQPQLLRNDLGNENVPASR